MAIIGIDLGGTKLSAALFLDDGRIVKSLVRTLDQRAGSEVGVLMRSLISDLLEHAAIEGLKPEALGCCVPGAVKNGKVWAPNIPGWDDYPLQQELENFLDQKPIKVFIESDRTCSILGETWQGAAKGCRNAIFLAVGTGIGAGIMVDGHILHGSNDIAGAIGWMALQKPFLEKYRSCGCFEYHASGEGLAKVAEEYYTSYFSDSAKDQQLNSGTINAHDLFEAYTAADPLAIRVISEAVEFWGMAAANLVSLFNPQKIIFGGGIFGPAGQFIAKIYREAEKWAQPLAIRQVNFEISQLGGNAALYGAAYLAYNNKKQIRNG